ncbi:hypothetical protein [Neorhizobium galegae]|uniref:hypothetical protein n=2 Tax=Neorhizobium galegae TaxID=399 RepID=UPI001287D2DC|nr:hypothetical protein [Neorhizobium galegae]KAA9382403.1 hypothetical protein F4V88_30450 [Neorhizobium galegae]MCM2502037.1 hypothetical protein [Neorhizobium galegae]MCQ1855692.1 hypothetical protein [Neorhizobium galegae]
MTQIDMESRLTDEHMNEASVHRSTSRRPHNQHRNRQSIFEELIRLNGMGWSQLAIKRELGIDLKTIRKWLKDNQPGTWERKVFDRVPSRGVATDIHGVFRAWPEGVSARHCW